MSVAVRQMYVVIIMTALLKNRKMQKLVQRNKGRQCQSGCPLRRIDCPSGQRRNDVIFGWRERDYL